MEENIFAPETQTLAPPLPRGRSWAQVMERYGILIVFLLLVAASALLSPVFLHPTNILNVLRQISITGIIALGMTFVILTAGIDLSVGSVVALVTVFAASFQRLGLVPVLLVGLTIGSALGLVNGMGVAMGRIPPLIMTLAMMYMGRGLAFMYSGGLPIYGIRPAFIQFGNGFTAGIPNSVLYFVALLILSIAVLRFTAFGRFVLAIGSNEEAARLAGVRVRRVKVQVYLLSGILSGFAGLIYTGQLGIGVALAGLGYELSAIAAVVIGGTSLFGGQGSIFGTFLGAAIIGVTNNLLNLLGIDPLVQDFMKGLIILAAVLINRRRA
jgi:ribose/xylose/arabinose/galactoside ABC-type transport system permease subunit